MSKGYILGISCGYHDSAASLIKDGKVLGAVEEERFTGIKHDSSFPLESIKWLYSEFKVNKDDVDAIYIEAKKTVRLAKAEAWKAYINPIKEEQKEVKEFIKQVASIKAHNWMHNSIEDKLKALRDLGKKSK